MPVAAAAATRTRVELYNGFKCISLISVLAPLQCLALNGVYQFRAYTRIIIVIMLFCVRLNGETRFYSLYNVIVIATKRTGKNIETAIVLCGRSEIVVPVLAPFAAAK